MASERKGRVAAINGNMVAITFDSYVIQNEVAYVACGADRLKAEVIRVRGNKAEAQVYESTTGVKVGDEVTFTDALLSVELGPGLLGQIFDGLQNPLPDLAKECGFFLKRGVYKDPLPDVSQWDFTPMVKAGHKVRAGEKLGTVPEMIFKHAIMVPFGLRGEWEVSEIVPAGRYALKDVVARLKDANGKLAECRMVQVWPVKVAIKAYAEKFMPTEPLVTKIRLIDSLFPVARGGTYCIPGPFGAGKTVLQQLTSRYADVDIVIIAA